jgi:DNA adenine methylase
VKPVLKYPGSKWKIAEWIIEQMPEHHSYIEPFFGSGAVFFSKPPSKIETINDLDSRVPNLFKIIRDEPERLAALIAGTPYSKEEYDNSFVSTDDIYESTRRFLVQCWQSHTFRVNEYKCGWKIDVQGRDKAYAMYNWYRLPRWLLDTTERLRHAQIENMNAVELIQKFNYKNVLIYADPPYILDTRSEHQYMHEMSDDENIKLLEALLGHKGPVMVSGYASALYNKYLIDWHCISRNNYSFNAVGGKQNKEALWMNFEPAAQIKLNI